MALFFAWRSIFRPVHACKPDEVCAVPRVRTAYKIIFWIVVALVLIADRKSTRLNSSHSQISYAVFCLKKKKIQSYAGDGLRLFLPLSRRCNCYGEIEQLAH